MTIFIKIIISLICFVFGILIAILGGIFLGGISQKYKVNLGFLCIILSIIVESLVMLPWIV